MKQLGFTRSTADDYLYVKHAERGAEVLVLIYVDNMAVAAADVCSVGWLKVELGKAFQITDLGELKHILGIRVKRNCAARRI